MDKRSSFLNKMADRILKAADQADALKKSKERSDKIKLLHEAITDKYRFKISRHESVEELEGQVAFLKKVEKTLSLTWSQEQLLERLFNRYGIK